MITVGHQRYGLDPTDLASVNQKCQHGRSVTNEDTKTLVGTNSVNANSPSGIKIAAVIVVILILIASCFCLYRKWSKSKNGMSKMPETNGNNDKVSKVNNSEVFSHRDNEPGFSSSPDKNNFSSSPDIMHFEVKQ